MNIGNTKVVAITVYQGSPTASLRISLNNAHHLLHNQELKKYLYFVSFFSYLQ